MLEILTGMKLYLSISFKDRSPLRRAEDSGGILSAWGRFYIIITNSDDLHEPDLING